MKVTIEITPQQEKFLKMIYGDRSLSALFQLWFNEWLEKRVEKEYTPTKTLDEKLEELTK